MRVLYKFQITSRTTGLETMACVIEIHRNLLSGERQNGLSSAKYDCLFYPQTFWKRGKFPYKTGVSFKRGMVQKIVIKP